MNGFVILTDIGKVVPVEEYNKRLTKGIEKRIKGQDIRQWILSILEDAIGSIEDEVSKMP